MSDVPKQPVPASTPRPDQASEKEPYEWSATRVAEGVIINVVSASIIGIGGLILAGLFSLIALIASALHAPAGLLGLISLFVLAVVLVLIALAITIWALIRRLSPGAAAGLAIGLFVWALVDAALEKGGGISDILRRTNLEPQPQSQDQNEKDKGENK